MAAKPEGGHRMVPLDELIADPKNPRYVNRIPKKILKALERRHVVKVCVAAAKGPHKAYETLPVIISHADQKKNRFRGVVNARPDRWLWHGVQFDEELHFRREHVIDVFQLKA